MKKLDFQGLNRHLLARAHTLLSSWLPGGRVVGHEFKAGDITGSTGESLSINMQTGKWADFAADLRGGDLISLYAAIRGINAGDAFRQLSADHGWSGEAPRPLEPTRGPELDLPPPGIPKPTMNHARYGQPAETYEYRGPQGELLHYVARYHEADGSKQFVPFSWSKTSKNWVMKAWPKPRPLYGLDLLALHPSKPVMIVEGEKAAHAARMIEGMPYVVITWSQGAQAWKMADWSPIQDRDVILWPDADQPGVQAMAGVASLLVMGNKTVKVLDVSDMPLKWDVADAAFKKTAELIEWARPRVRVVDRPLVPTKPEAIQAQVERVEHHGPVTAAQIWNALPDKTRRGKIHGTIENFQTMLNMLDVVIRYNVISKREEVLIPNESFSVDNRGNAAYAWLLSWCNACQIPTGPLKNFITFVAEKTPYNPVATWIESKAWDGKSRLQDLYDTVKAKNEDGDPTIKRLKEAMIRRWLISAAAAAFKPDGVSAHGVLVFQGDQYLGKTMWFKKLVPRDLEVVSDGRTLKPDDKDSVKQIVSNWLVELGELDATFRKSDISQLKSFLTKDKDVLRLSYAPVESEFARRTVFFASVNPARFLHDETGNRRFWTIECEKINYEHTIDMQQLWAEVTEIYRKGESWFLNKTEIALLNDHNEDFTTIEPVAELVASRLNWEADEAFWEWKTITEVLQELKFDKITRSDLNHAGEEIRKRNGGRRKKNNARKLVFVPPKVSNVLPYRPSGPLFSPGD